MPFVFILCGSHGFTLTELAGNWRFIFSPKILASNCLAARVCNCFVKVDCVIACYGVIFQRDTRIKEATIRESNEIMKL